MLVLCRTQGEFICIGDDIQITLVIVRQGIVRLGLGLPYDVTPGVPAYAAAAAELKQELTLPEISQTIIATRTTMHASAMPEGEDLAKLAASRATLAIHLSVRNLNYVQHTLIPHYGEDCPVVMDLNHFYYSQ